MERILSQFDLKKTNFYSDSSHRMKERPYSVQSGEGRGHEDFGSSFAPSQPSRPVQGKTTTSKVRPATLHPIITNLEQHSSDDELLLSASDSPVHKRAVRGKATVSTPQEVDLAPNGHPYHPDYLPNKKLPSFTKKKKDSQVENIITEGPSFPNPDDPISDDLSPQTLLSQPSANSKRGKDAGSSKCTMARLDGASPPPANTRDYARRKPAERYVSRKPASPSPPSENKPPKSIQHRVRPRPIQAGSSNSRHRSPEATPRASKPQPFPPPSLSLACSGNSRADNVSPPRKNVREPSQVKGERANVSTNTVGEKTSALSRQHTAPFPMTPPGKSNPHVRQPLQDAKAPRPFPLPELASKEVQDSSDTLGNFPVPSPLASKVQPPSLNKGKGRALVDEDGTDDLAMNSILRPFPMNSGEIKTASHRNRQLPSESMGSKRTSDDSDGERGRKVKRHKESNPGNWPILREEDPLEENSLELDRVVDPSTICPYCDEPLPRNPTPQLKNLLAIAKRKSHADPRPRNPRGLKAPLGIYISACQRHQFETHIFPEAMDKGWPQSIDFKKVPKRVEGMKSALEAIITSADICSEDEDSRDIDAKGPRARSVFWEEVKKEIKKQGSRTVTGVKGQFASFEKTQPGYYGELGSLIIHQTLYNLFPFSSVDTSLIAPFTPAEFIQRVLVPEAAVGLIMQDLHLDKDEAVVTLRESSQYGVAMFPDTSTGKGAAFGAGDDDEGVADRIVMERAKARRLEIEEEDRLEEQMLKEEQEKRRSKAQMERKERARQRAEQLKKSKGTAGYTSREVSEASESESRCGWPKTQKAGPRMATDSETDNMSVGSVTSRRSTRSRTGTRKTHRIDSAKSASSDMQISDDSSVEIMDRDQQPQVKRYSRRGASTSSAVARPDDVGQLSDASSSKTRTRRLKSLRGDDLDTDMHIGDTPLKSVLEVDEESTPRPRWSKAPTVIRPHPTLGLSRATALNILPLQVARSRSATSATTYASRKNLTGGVSDAEDSDNSQEGQSSRKSHHWLLSQSSSSSSSSS